MRQNAAENNAVGASRKQGESGRLDVQERGRHVCQTRGNKGTGVSPDLRKRRIQPPNVKYDSKGCSVTSKAAVQNTDAAMTTLVYQ